MGVCTARAEDAGVIFFLLFDDYGEIGGERGYDEDESEAWMKNDQSEVWSRGSWVSVDVLEWKRNEEES